MHRYALLPSRSSLIAAAQRGGWGIADVEVDIILPEANNLALVKWASHGRLWQVLERGCRVWMSPPPFDHYQADARRSGLDVVRLG